MPITSANSKPVTPKPKRKVDWSTPVHRSVTALPIVAVNGVATIGQFVWAHANVTSWHIGGQILIAVALESIALFFAYHAYLAEKANDSALRLKLAAYGFGLFIGVINYSHWAINWRPTTAAVVVGTMSASSPWLWSTYSRRVSRNVLMSRGLIEEHALKLGFTRWLWHPYNSFKLMRMATWLGENHVTKAIAMLDDLYSANGKGEIHEVSTPVHVGPGHGRAKAN
jgi:hypothetical protein